MSVASRLGRRPNVLYVSETWTHGARVRCLSILQALQQIGTVEVALLLNPQSNHSAAPTFGAGLEQVSTYRTRSEPNSTLAQKVKFTIDPKTDYPFGCAVHHGGHEELARTAEKFDLVWFFKQRAADMFPNARWRCSVVDIDDVQSTYERALVRAGRPAERLKALRAYYVWRRRERLLDGRFDVLTACTEDDKSYLHRLGLHCPIHVVPNGFERPQTEPARDPIMPPRLGFIGGFDHLPNLDGVTWFLKKCWPQIKRKIPQARLRLIGQDGDKFCDAGMPDIDCLGWLASPSEEIKTWAAMIVPIRVGAGTRVKIAQGFSEKCPIVSTSFGALGYGAVDGRQMYLADSAAAFSNACIRTILQPEEAEKMAQRAWFEFLEKWTWDAIYPRVWKAAEECLRLNGHTPSRALESPLQRSS